MLPTCWEASGSGSGGARGARGDPGAASKERLLVREWGAAPRREEATGDPGATSKRCSRSPAAANASVLELYAALLCCACNQHPHFTYPSLLDRVLALNSEGP